MRQRLVQCSRHCNSQSSNPELQRLAEVEHERLAGLNKKSARRRVSGTAVKCNCHEVRSRSFAIRLDTHFERPDLLERALTHSSHAHEESKAGGDAATEKLDNEQFEFLGDAVLGLVTSQLLFERFPTFHEGQLSKLKAHLVSAEHLVGRGYPDWTGAVPAAGTRRGTQRRQSKGTLLSDAIEAVIAAMYLDAGLEKTRDFIIRPDS